MGFSFYNTNQYSLATVLSLLCLCLAHLAGLASGFSASNPAINAHEILANSKSLMDPITGETVSFFPPSTSASYSSAKSLVVLLPQLGEFDSSEYCEFLIAAQESLSENGIALRVIGIGDTVAARSFCEFTGLSPENLVIDPKATIHKELGLYEGPGLSIPESLLENEDLLRFFLKQLPGEVPTDPEELRSAATAWLNYNAMCAGIGAPGTLREILRGYFGDLKAPERFKEDDVVRVGDLLEIGPGVGPTRIAAFRYNQWFSDEKGYQRPVELATVRLKNMVEVLTKWNRYVSNIETIPQRGGTFLFDGDGSELYSYQSRGVLTYSETMPRPLSFLAPYIGEATARNPLGLTDNGGGKWKRGRGVWKPLGKFLGFFSVFLKLETVAQARAQGADKSDRDVALRAIEETIFSHKIVVYTYGLSPFSWEAKALLKEMGAEYHEVALGAEWFLLGKEESATREALLKKTGQSSLPHVFIDGQHIGGLFTGNEVHPNGLAGLKESGALETRILPMDSVATTKKDEASAAAGAAAATEIVAP